MGHFLLSAFQLGSKAKENSDICLHILKYTQSWEFPGGIVVRISGFTVLAQVQSPISGWGTEILQAVQCGQKEKKSVGNGASC